MKTGTLAIAVACALAIFFSGLSQAQTTKPVALKGFDPILLAGGKEVPGKPTLSSTYQRFTYLFATEADKKTFDAAPAQHAVQFGGACVHMPSMKGDPNLYLVYQGKIYLAANQGCYAGASANLADSIKSAEETLRQQRIVEVMVFSGVQDIDYAGPVEVFSDSGFKIVTVAATEAPVTTVAGITITPDYTFDDAPHAEIIVLPGGSVPPVNETDPRIRWITKAAKDTPHILSVCNGAFWLANAGLLDGKEATTTFGNIPLLEKFSKIHVRGDQRFTDNGQIVTSAGLSAGIDGALHTVEKIYDAETAGQVARIMEYNWLPTNGFARGALADRNLLWIRRSNLSGFKRVNISKEAGDTENWIVSYDVLPQNTSAAELRKAFQAAAEAQKWTAVSSAGDATTFQFTDKDGKSWKAVVTAAAAADQSKIAFTIELHKNG